MSNLTMANEKFGLDSSMHGIEKFNPNRTLNKMEISKEDGIAASKMTVDQSSAANNNYMVSFELQTNL